MPTPNDPCQRPRGLSCGRAPSSYARASFSLALLMLCGACASVDGQLEDLSSEDYEDRIEAVTDITADYRSESSEHLARRGDILIGLGAALQDPSSLVRQFAIEGLAAVGGSEATGLIVDRLRDQDLWVRHESALALGRLQAKSARKALEDTLSDDRAPEVRKQAALALGQIGERSSAKSLYLGLGDPNAAVRFASLQSLRSVTGEDRGDDPRDWRSVVR